MKRIFSFALAAIIACGAAGAFALDFEVAPVQVDSVDTEAPSIGDIGADIGSGLNFDVASVDDVSAPEITVDVGARSLNLPDIADVAADEVRDMYLDLLPYMNDVDLQALSDLSPIEAADYAQLQCEVANVLMDEFNAIGLNVNFDPASGAIVLDSSVLYATDAYQISESGKALVRQVMGVLCSVLTRDEYRDSVSQIMIAGHTDTDGSHEYNQTLSERRANGVMEFCLSEECSLQNTDWLASKITARGFSYDHLIRNFDGSENKAASRRVEIRFSMKVA